MSKLEDKKQRIRDELGIVAPKAHRKRKPMTEEQKAAASARLAAARAAKGPAKNTNIHPSVVSLPEDHPLSLEKVKEWLKYNRDFLKSIKAQKDSKDSKERMEYQVIENYIKNLNIYLKDNVWCDHRYGKQMEHTMTYVVTVPAGDSYE